MVRGHLVAAHEVRRSGRWATPNPDHAVFVIRVGSTGSGSKPPVPQRWSRRGRPTARRYMQRSPDISCALKSLAHALQAKDPYTAGHSMRVAAIAKAMAEEMGLPADETRQIAIGAELHDIGKIGVPEHLLHKPGELSDAEYQQVMQHTVMGAEIVAPLLGADSTVRDVVRWHHEHLDGWGGPDGLEGDAIPLAARIVAVADAFDAMTTARPYRRALTTDMTLAELRREAGSHFDPMCVDVLETLLPASALAVAS